MYYIYMKYMVNHFAIYLKLTQHCKSITYQLKMHSLP